MQAPDSGDPIDPKSLKAELVRLRIKRADTDDPDIQKALDERIAQLESQVPPKEPEPEEEPAPPPTPEQAEEADRIVRLARVEKMRGNSRAASDLLKRAAEVAPGSPAVLEALGDDLVERKMMQQAAKIYFRAWKADPKNVGLERKYAATVIEMDAAGSFEDQMRAGLGGAVASPSADPGASMGGAIVLSALLPGAGHIVLGRREGYGILAAWIGCIAWLGLMYPDIARLFAMATGAAGQPNLLVLVPIMLALMIYMGTLASLKSSQKAIQRRKVERPKPPVDLPFE